MTKIEIIIGEDLRFKITCNPSEAMGVVGKVLRELSDGKKVIIHYKAKKDDGIKFDREAVARIYFNKEIPFHGNLKSITVFDKGLSEDEIIRLTSK